MHSRRQTRRAHRGGGGIFVDNHNYAENFKEFILNSEVQYMSKGSNGVTLKVTLDPSKKEHSKYRHMEYQQFGEPVLCLLVKLVVIENPDGDDIPVSTATREEFQDEVNTQVNVFMKTMQYLQPLCPAVVYSGYLTKKDPTILKHILDNSFESRNQQQLTEKQKYELSDVVDNFESDMTFGIIGMEIANGYELVNNVIPTVNGKKTVPENAVYAALHYYLVIEMAMQTGLCHGDFHFGNSMYNPNDTTYLVPKQPDPSDPASGPQVDISNMKGSAILIDFGLAAPIPPDTMQTLKALYSKGDYKQMMNVLISVPRRDYYDMRSHPTYTSVTDANISNAYMAALYAARDNAKEIVRTTMNSKTEEERKLKGYPLIPLSNAARNKIFPGMIEEQTSSKRLYTLKPFEQDVLILDAIADVIVSIVYKTLIPYFEDTDMHFNGQVLFDIIFQSAANAFYQMQHKTYRRKKQMDPPKQVIRDAHLTILYEMCVAAPNQSLKWYITHSNKAKSIYDTMPTIDSEDELATTVQIKGQQLHDVRFARITINTICLYMTPSAKAKLIEYLRFSLKGTPGFNSNMTVEARSILKHMLTSFQLYALPEQFAAQLIYAMRRLHPIQMETRVRFHKCAVSVRHPNALRTDCRVALWAHNPSIATASFSDMPAFLHPKPLQPLPGNAVCWVRLCFL